jgi:hypothetical protein
MAKLTAPLFSMEAAGKLGANLIYQTWRGRPYVRKLTKSKSTPTPHQVAIRKVVAICPALWNALPDEYRQDWAAYRPDLNITDFQKFVGFQIDRHNTKFYNPSGEYENDLIIKYSPTATLSAGDHDRAYLSLSVTPTHIQVNVPQSFQNWGRALIWGVWRAPVDGGAYDVSPYFTNIETANLRGYVPAGVYEFTDRDITPGQGYAYRVELITPAGWVSAFESEF